MSPKPVPVRENPGLRTWTLIDNLNSGSGHQTLNPSERTVSEKVVSRNPGPFPHRIGCTYTGRYDICRKLFRLGQMVYTVGTPRGPTGTIPRPLSQGRVPFSPVTVAPRSVPLGVGYPQTLTLSSRRPTSVPVFLPPSFSSPLFKSPPRSSKGQ